MSIFYYFLLPVIAYFLGSLPFGYIISRWSTGKNILEIGWKKTSGSNVFRNIGKWQGVLTGILDFLKGFLAIFIAKKLELPIEIQVFSGIAVIVGNNWSCFLKFAGGRGVGTFLGAFLALSPQVLGISLAPFILLTLIWDASIGTLSFFAFAIFISWQTGQFIPAGLFPTLALIPILIKRLSPVGEIKLAKNYRNLMVSRLIFDNNKMNLELRIKRILKSLTKK